MITIHKFIKNDKIRSFKTTETKVITSIVTNDKFVINPTLEQFLESGWQLYIESEHKQPIINNIEEVQTVEVVEEENDVEETNEVAEENTDSPVEGENNENQEQVNEDTDEEITEEVNNENNTEETVQIEENVNEE